LKYANTCHNVVIFRRNTLRSKKGDVAFHLQAVLLVVPLLIIGVELPRAPATEVRAELAPTPAHLTRPIRRRFHNDLTAAEVGLLREVPEAGLDLLDLTSVDLRVSLQ
jgi:hypothetical protein